MMVKEDNILQNKLCTNSDSAELERIRSFVINKASMIGFNEIDVGQIALAVDEACANLIKHAFKNNNAKIICIKIEHINNGLIINIFDDGKPFNPLDVPDRDMKEYFKNFERGGLGIHIIKKVMDEINYFPAKKGKPQNKLQLKKYLPS